LHRVADLSRTLSHKIADEQLHAHKTKRNQLGVIKYETIVKLHDLSETLQNVHHLERCKSTMHACIDRTHRISAASEIVSTPIARQSVNERRIGRPPNPNRPANKSIPIGTWERRFEAMLSDASITAADICQHDALKGLLLWPAAYAQCRCR